MFASLLLTAGIGSAMNDTTRQLGGALGVAVLGTVLNLAYIGGVNALKGSLPAEVVAQSAQSIQAAHQTAQSLNDPALAQRLISSADRAYVLGMAHAIELGAAALVVAVLVALVVLPAKVGERVEAPARESLQPRETA